MPRFLPDPFVSDSVNKDNQTRSTHCSDGSRVRLESRWSVGSQGSEGGRVEDHEALRRSPQQLLPRGGQVKPTLAGSYGRRKLSRKRETKFKATARRTLGEGDYERALLTCQLSTSGQTQFDPHLTRESPV